MIVLVALILSLVGFAGVALSMHKHHCEVFGAGPTRLRLMFLRCTGWLSLGLSFATSVVASGWAIGPVLWLGLLTAAGLIVTLLLTFQRSIKPSNHAVATTRGATKRASF